MQRVSSNGFLSDALQYFLSKAVPGISFTVFVALAIKLVGSDAYGIYSSVFSSATFLAVLAVGWFNQAQLRFAGSKEQAVTPRLRCRALLISSSIISAVAALWAGLCFLWPSMPPIPYIETAVLALVYVLYLIQLTGLQADIRAKDYRRMETLRAITLIVVVLLIAVAGFREWLTLVVSVLLSLIVPLLVIRKPVLYRPEAALSAVPLRDCFSYGWPVSLWLALQALLPAFERWLILASYSGNELGAYSGLYDILVRGTGLLLFPVTMALHPRYMSAVNNNKVREAKKYLQLCYRWSLVIAGLLIIAWLIGLERLLYSILPELEAGSSGYLWYMVISVLLWQFALIVHKPLEAQKKTRLMLVFSSLCTVFIIIFDLVMVGTIGIVALPVASGVGAMFYIILCLGWQLNRR